MTGPAGTMPPPGATIATLAWWTLRDECRARSLGLLAVVCLGLVAVFRGCAPGSVVVNGAPLDASTLLMHGTFHGLAAGVLLVVALRAMRLFHREREDGTLASVLARPVARWHYLAGKVAGLWGAAVASLLVLHGVLGLLLLVETGTVRPGLLLASLACSLNLLLVVVAVLAFSLWLPDFLAFLLMLAIGLVSVVGQAIAAAAPLVHAAASPAGPGSSGLPWWQVAWALWPKLGGVQMAAAALIDGSPVLPGAGVSPVVNVLVYCGIFAALCYAGFSREDIV